MPSWSTVEPAELKAIVQYIKTFSPRWRKEKVGTPLPLPHDPWARDADKARRRGRVVYHGVARCWQCHPSYLGEDEIRRLQSRLPVNERLPLRANPRQPLSVPTEYGPTLAPAFKKYQLRGGNRPSDVFRTIATGIPGTPMPAWHPKLSGRELWALTHYVRSLVGLEPGIKDNESQTRVNRK